MIMGMPMIRDPKNITDMNECAFRIGVEGKPEKSIQDMLDSRPSGYSSKEETASSARLIFEDLGAMIAFGKGYVISLIRGLKIEERDGEDFICSSRKEYCIRCGFNKPKGCDIPLDLHEMASANGLSKRY